MNDYIEVRFSISPYEEAYADVLSAILADSGFESFVAAPDGLTAYVSQRLYDRDTIDTAILNFPIDDVTITHRDILVEGRDWNAEWEKNYFKPIVIGKSRARFSIILKASNSVTTLISLHRKEPFST